MDDVFGWKSISVIWKRFGFAESTADQTIVIILCVWKKQQANFAG